MKRALLILFSIALLSACGGDDEKATTTTTAAPTAEAPPTGNPNAGNGAPTNTTARPGAGSGSPATTAAPVQRGNVDVKRGADAFLQAWQKGDATAAQQYGEPGAVSTMFRTTYASNTITGLQGRGCANNPAFQGQMTCSYQYDKGNMNYIMLKSGNYYTVNRVEFENN